MQLRFYIQYDLHQPVPSVVSIRLNGRVICNATDSNDSNNRGTSRPNVRPTSQSNTRPHQQTSSSQNRPLNVDADSYVATDQQNEFNPAFGTSKPATSRPNNVRPNTNQQSNSRPQQSSNSNTRPTYQNQNNEYDSGSSSRPNVNRPLNVDVDSYGTNQNEFAPAFGSVPDGNQFNQGSAISTDNNNNNR